MEMHALLKRSSLNVWILRLVTVECREAQGQQLLLGSQAASRLVKWPSLTVMPLPTIQTCKLAF